MDGSPESGGAPKGSDDQSPKWQEAKVLAVRVLSKLAVDQATITYREFVRRIKALPDLKYHGDERLTRLLTEVSLEEDAAGRGLVSVLVVSAQQPSLPSYGFWEIVSPRYPKGTSKLEIFSAERDKVWAAHDDSAD